MTKGVFAHLTICGDMCHKGCITLLSQDNMLLSIEPFTTETAHTLFNEGIVMVAASTFDAVIPDFISSLREQLGSANMLIDKAITSNVIYRQHPPSPNEPCTLYAITPIAWSSMQIAEPSLLSVSKITL